MREQPKRSATLYAIGAVVVFAIGLYILYRWRLEIAGLVLGHGFGLVILLAGALRGAGPWFPALLATAFAGYAIFAIAKSRLSVGLGRKAWIWSILFVLLLTPYAVYEKATWRYESFAGELLSEPPGAHKLVKGIDWIGFEKDPGFGFEYETKVGSWLTHKYFRERLLAAGFSQEQDQWVDDERRAFYRSARMKVVCDITWRPGNKSCMPGYKRRDCDPTYDLVLGACLWLDRR
jgi:hypothetical protein